MTGASEHLLRSVRVEAVGIEQPGAHPIPTILERFGGQGDPVEGASIAYAIDAGSDAHWKLYVAPIAVPAGTTVRALAVRYGWAQSPEVSATVVSGD